MGRRFGLSPDSMCGRFSLAVPPRDLAERFGVSPPADLGPRYNCAPGQSLPVVARDDPEQLRRMAWGFTPSWADESFDLVNARAETAPDKRAFADAYESRRCLVPADGFYEWSTARPASAGGSETGGDADGPDASGTNKQPYRVAFEDDRVFAMAGLYETWERPSRQSGLGEFGSGPGTSNSGDGTAGVAAEDGQARVLEAFTVLTTRPNDLLSGLHDRMPVILPPDGEDAWLSGDLDHESVVAPHPDGPMTAYPVSTTVNSPAHDDPSLVEPLGRGF